MENSKKPTYKYCLVPLCKNTTKSTPDRIFFRVPNDEKIRRKWCTVMRRNKSVSTKSYLHCCEDHFNLEEDTRNFMEYKIMVLQEGKKVSLRLNKGILPHKFGCQRGNKPRPPKRMGAEKRDRKNLVREALEAATIKSDEPEREELNDRGAQPSKSSSLNVFTAKNEKSHFDKTIQVNIKGKYRRTGVNVNIIPKSKDIASSPFVVPRRNTSTSPLKSVAPKKKSFSDVVDTLSITTQSSRISTDCEPKNSSSKSSWSQDNSEDTDRQFKNRMRSGMLLAIEKEPRMLLGLSKKKHNKQKSGECTHPPELNAVACASSEQRYEMFIKEELADEELDLGPVIFQHMDCNYRAYKEELLLD